MWQVRWLRGDGYNYSCQGDNDCLGVCINSSKVEYHFAESPAFVLEQYGSKRYSTWAESTLVIYCLCIFSIACHRWSTILLRMYLVTSVEHQVTARHLSILMFIFKSGCTLGFLKSLLCGDAIMCMCVGPRDY